MSKLFEIELDLYNKKHKYIACIDEVGRGCLYGEVVACALILPPYYNILGTKDSKKLSEKKRKFLYEYIVHNSIGLGLACVSPQVIDQINIKEATRLAMKNALENLIINLKSDIRPSMVLIDAETIDTNIPQMNLIKGDDLVHGISAASIVAKVYRDNLCLKWDKENPGYDLANNKGYGTKNHISALNELGPSINHRRTFIKKILEGIK